MNLNLNVIDVENLAMLPNNALTQDHGNYLDLMVPVQPNQILLMIFHLPKSQEHVGFVEIKLTELINVPRRKGMKG